MCVIVRVAIAVGVAASVGDSLIVAIILGDGYLAVVIATI